MNRSFDGKVALVVGGSSGIGRAAAVAFAREGATVVVAARREDEGEATARLAREAGGDAIFVRADATRGVDLERLIGTVLERYSRLDCAFNNAGIEGTALTPTADYREEVWDQVLEANLKSVW